MAMSINVEVDFWTHPKTTQLVAALGRGAECFPLKLWSYCARYHRADGILRGYSVGVIEGIVGWTGEPGAAVQALLDCGKFCGRSGYLEQDPDGTFRVHDWTLHQGHLESAHRKSQAAARIRWGQTSTPKTTAHAPSNAPSNARSNTPSMPQALPQACPEQCQTDAASNASYVSCGAVQCIENLAPTPEGEFDDEPFVEDPPEAAPPEPTPAPEPRRARRAKPEPKAGAVAAYCEAWREAYGEEPHPTGPECVSLNAALKSRSLSQEEGSALMRLYLADKDPWLVEKCHPLPFAVKRLDTLRAKKRQSDNPQAAPMPAAPPPRRPLPEPIPPRGSGPVPKLTYIPLPGSMD